MRPKRITTTAPMVVPFLALYLQSGMAQTTHGSGNDTDQPMHSMSDAGRPMDMTMMLRADNHAPAGVTGAEIMMEGRWMLSYSYMRMEMEDNLIGTRNVSPEEIVTTVPNRFFGTPGQPPTLRVVPTAMSTDMHMLGAMYAPTGKVTVMSMIPYLQKSMEHVTFQGPTGTTRLGTFTTEASGIGDVKVMGLFDVYQSGAHRVHLNAGLSFPTGNTTERDDVLTPGGARPTLRLPYPMQLGSGTYDLMPGVTYKGRADDTGWGAQYLATVRLDDNDEGYSLGDVHQATGWVSYSWTPGASASLRLTARSTGRVDGRDPNIVAPVQTADPSFQGGDRADLGVGINLSGQEGSRRGLRFGGELGIPIYQDLNGPQMEADWSFTAVLRYML